MIKEDDIRDYMKKFNVNREEAIFELNAIEEDYCKHEQEMQEIFESQY